MKTRTIKVTVIYDMTDPSMKHLKITPKEKVQEMVHKDMVKHFGWDEGYRGVEVEVIDE
jgi:hypothetical protein